MKKRGLQTYTSHLEMEWRKEKQIKIIAPYLICTTTGDTKHLTQNANWIGNRCVFFVLFFFATNKNRKLLIKHFWFAFFLALISLSIFYVRFFLFDFLSNCSIAFMICVYVWVFLHCFRALLGISSRYHQLNFAMSRHSMGMSVIAFETIAKQKQMNILIKEIALLLITLFW